MTKYLIIKLCYISKADIFSIILVGILLYYNDALNTTSFFSLLFILSDFSYIPLLNELGIIQKSFFSQQESVQFFLSNICYFLLPTFVYSLLSPTIYIQAILGSILAALLCNIFLKLKWNNYIYLTMFTLCQSLLVYILN